MTLARRRLIGAIDDRPRFAALQHPIPGSPRGSVTAAAPATSQVLLSNDLFTSEILMGQLTLTIGAVGSGGSTLVNFARAIFPSGSPVLWKENGAAKNQSSAGTSYTDGPGVSLTTVPEPSAFAMLAIGALGLVGFRRTGLRRTA